MRKILWFAQREVDRLERLDSAGNRKIQPTHRNDTDGVELDFAVIQRARQTLRDKAKIDLEGNIARVRKYEELYKGKPYPFKEAPE